MASLRATVFAAMGLVFGVGCHLIGGLDGYANGIPEDDSTAASGGASGTGGGGATGGTGGTTSATGGSGPVCDEAECSGLSTDCEACSCVGGIECDCDPLPSRTACTVEQTEGVCDADGTCVECLMTTDCPGGLFCDAKNCVPPGCADMVSNGNETGVDCGGPDCAPCGLGQPCNGPSDCATYKCANVCTSCMAPNDCPGSHYCQNMVCVPKLDPFESCTEDYECKSSNCVCAFGVCACGLL